MISQTKRGQRSRRPVRSWWRSPAGDAGASAVEFALIVPFLVMMAGGIIEMANVFYVRSQLQEIVRDATRRLAVDAMSPDDAEKFILDQLAQTTQAQGTVSIIGADEDDGKGDEAEDQLDVTISLNVPLRDIFFFDVIAEGIMEGGDEATDLTVSVTMFKH